MDTPALGLVIRAGNPNDNDSDDDWGDHLPYVLRLLRCCHGLRLLAVVFITLSQRFLSSGAGRRRKLWLRSEIRPRRLCRIGRLTLHSSRLLVPRLLGQHAAGWQLLLRRRRRRCQSLFRQKRMTSISIQGLVRLPSPRNENPLWRRTQWTL